MLKENTWEAAVNGQSFLSALTFSKRIFSFYTATNKLIP